MTKVNLDSNINNKKVPQNLLHLILKSTKEIIGRHKSQSMDFIDRHYSLVGILTGPLTLNRLSLAPWTKSAQIINHKRNKTSVK
jgi:hypothetical protein